MAKFGLAQPVRRVEDPRLLRGAGRYTDDIVLPGMLHRGRAAQPARRGADHRASTPTAAAAIPGVLAVYTAADLKADGIGSLPCAAPVKNRDGSAQVAPPHPVLAEGAVHHVGDPVAFVVADTAQAGARRRRGDRGRLRHPARDHRPRDRDRRRRRRWSGRRPSSNLVFDWEIGDKAATDAAVRQGRARHAA